VKNITLLKGKKLALFFTFNVSLKQWHDIGIIDREVAIYNKLSKYFNQIYFFTYGDHEDLKFQGYLKDNIIIVPIPFSHKHSQLLLLIRLIYSLLLPIIHYRILKDVDILKTNQMCGSWTAVITKLLLKKKLVVRTGFMWSINAKKKRPSFFMNLIIKIIEGIAYLFADGITVSSPKDLEYVNKNYNSKGIRIVIPNYVDTEIFKPQNIKKRDCSICFVGRLVKEKNLFSLLKAISGLHYELTIIGSGPLKDDLKKCANQNGINVRFPGIIPNNKLPEILNQHELFILPSLYEGMPKALLEAMACGLPVIGTNVYGIREVIRHEKNGILCGTNPESIREAILKLMNDEKLKQKISIEARKTIEKFFSIKKIIEKEFDLYLNLFAFN